MKSVFPSAACALLVVVFPTSCTYYPVHSRVVDDSMYPRPPLPRPPVREDPDEMRDYDRYGIPRERPPERRRPAPRPEQRQEPTYERIPENAVDPDPAPPRHPVAKRTDKPNEVLSPFAPYHRIDVTGFKSGDLAKDPKNGKIFRVP